MAWWRKESFEEREGEQDTYATSFFSGPVALCRQRWYYGSVTAKLRMRTARLESELKEREHTRQFELAKRRIDADLEARVRTARARVRCWCGTLT